MLAPRKNVGERRLPESNRCNAPVELSALRPLRGGRRAIVVEGDCWIWQGTVNSRGYACRGRDLVHRVVFETHVRPLLLGEQVHHRCERKACVNPVHLEAHSHLEHERLHAGVDSRAALVLNALSLGPRRFAEIDELLRSSGHDAGAATAIYRMRRRGEIIRLGHGLYALPEGAGVTGFFRSLFQSPAERHAETVAVFRKRGFSEADAERAARDLWIACRTGSRTPQWILDRLPERRAREREAVSPSRRAD